MADAPDLHEVALAVLARRALTVTELRTRLARGGFEPGLIAAEIERLAAVQLLDDRAVAYDHAHRRATEGRRGPARVAAELRARGIAADLVDDAVGAAFPADNADAALRLAFDKLTRGTGVPPTRPERDRLIRRLLRAGFPVSQVLALLERTGCEGDELPGPGEDDDHAVE
jgi:regulatory protein